MGQNGLSVLSVSGGFSLAHFRRLPLKFTPEKLEKHARTDQAWTDNCGPAEASAHSS